MQSPTEYLSDGDRGGAHARHRPADLAPSGARRQMTAVVKKSAEHERLAFADICIWLRPVFCYFCFECFLPTVRVIRAEPAALQQRAVLAVGHLADGRGVAVAVIVKMKPVSFDLACFE